MNESNIPETQIEAIRFFSDLMNCHTFLVSMRWPDGKVTCPHCDSDKIGIFSGKRLVSNCKNCKKQFTVKVGTIFEDSPLPLSKWLPAFWLIVNAKNGISSCELSRSLGVTQKTAWHMGHRIRRAIQIGSFAKMQGIVEADETYIGAKARNMHFGKRKVQGTGGIGKAAVQGLLERHSATGKSRVIAKVIPNARKHIVQGNVREYVLKGSQVDARPRTEGDGKGADRGVDGMLYFYESKDERKKILIQVKGGGVQRNDISTLLGDVNNQKFVGGILITLEKPTKPMREEAADAGRYKSKIWHEKDYPKIQILTVEGLMGRKERVEAPPQMNPFAKETLI